MNDILIKVWKKKTEWKNGNPEVKEWIHCYSTEAVIKELERIKLSGDYDSVSIWKMIILSEEFLKAVDDTNEM